MKLQNPLNAVLCPLLIGLLIGLMPGTAEAARIDDVTRGSTLAQHFTVEAAHEEGQVRVSVVAPPQMDGYEISDVFLVVGDQRLVRSNGTELSFLIDEQGYGEAMVVVSYVTPNPDPDESGGFWVLRLDIEDLTSDFG